MTSTIGRIIMGTWNINFARAVAEVWIDVWSKPMSLSAWFAGLAPSFFTRIPRSLPELSLR
jgi:hypothetical protein